MYVLAYNLASYYKINVKVCATLIRVPDEIDSSGDKRQKALSLNPFEMSDEDEDEDEFDSIVSDTCKGNEEDMRTSRETSSFYEAIGDISEASIPQTNGDMPFYANM